MSVFIFQKLLSYYDSCFNTSLLLKGNFKDFYLRALEKDSARPCLLNYQQYYLYTHIVNIRIKVTFIYKIHFKVNSFVSTVQRNRNHAYCNIYFKCSVFYLFLCVHVLFLIFGQSLVIYSLNKYRKSVKSKKKNVNLTTVINK